jgi:hypothetical protein
MKSINIFTRHPEQVRMSYLQHTRFALMLSVKTFGCAIASLIHAFFPFLFVNFTSVTIYKLHGIFEKREHDLKKKN